MGNFVKNWKIDAIYEDEDGVEFFDNLAIAKLKKGISLKTQGYSNDQITFHLAKLMPEKMETHVEKKELPAKKDSTSKAELQNLTIDVTGQTLQMLADAVAEKITTGIKNSDFINQLLQDSSLKSDNESLSKKVGELMDDNKKLAQRVEELEQRKKLSPINFEYFRKFFK